MQAVRDFLPNFTCASTLFAPCVLSQPMHGLCCDMSCDCIMLCSGDLLCQNPIAACSFEHLRACRSELHQASASKNPNCLGVKLPDNSNKQLRWAQVGLSHAAISHGAISHGAISHAAISHAAALCVAISRSSAGESRPYFSTKIS